MSFAVGPSDGSDAFGARFLRSPDLFPARLAGEALGDLSAVLDLAGGSYRLHGLNARTLEVIERRYGSLVRPTPDEADTWTTTIFRAREEFLGPEALSGEYTLDLEYHADALRISGLGFMAHIRLGSERSGGLWVEERRLDRFESAIENYLRILVAFGTLARGGVVLHSAGIRFEDRGYLFVGASGTGKSTLARVSASDSREVLGDDLNALQPTGNGMEIRPLPFAGDFPTSGGDRGIPLHRLALISQGEPHEVRPLPPALAAARLISCAPFVNRDPHRIDALCDVVARITDQVPAAELTFTRDAAFWKLLIDEDR